MLSIKETDEVIDNHIRTIKDELTNLQKLRLIQNLSDNELENVNKLRKSTKKFKSKIDDLSQQIKTDKILKEIEETKQKYEINIQKLDEILKKSEKLDLPKTLSKDRMKTVKQLDTKIKEKTLKLTELKTTKKNIKENTDFENQQKFVNELTKNLQIFEEEKGEEANNAKENIGKLLDLNNIKKPTNKFVENVLNILEQETKKLETFKNEENINIEKIPKSIREEISKNEVSFIPSGKYIVDDVKKEIDKMKSSRLRVLHTIEPFNFFVILPFIKQNNPSTYEKIRLRLKLDNDMFPKKYTLLEGFNDIITTSKTLDVLEKNAEKRTEYKQYLKKTGKFQQFGGGKRKSAPRQQIKFDMFRTPILKVEYSEETKKIHDISDEIQEAIPIEIFQAIPKADLDKIVNKIETNLQLLELIEILQDSVDIDNILSPQNKIELLINIIIDGFMDLLSLKNDTVINYLTRSLDVLEFRRKTFAVPEQEINKIHLISKEIDSIIEDDMEDDSKSINDAISDIEHNNVDLADELINNLDNVSQDDNDSEIDEEYESDISTEVEEVDETYLDD